MSQVIETAPSGKTVDEEHPRPRKRRRAAHAGASVSAQGEPMLWLTGGGLAVCVSMIMGLLGLVLWHGTTTFWPGPVVQTQTLSGTVHLGEPFATDAYDLKLSALSSLNGPERDAAAELLYPAFRSELARLLDSGRLAKKLTTSSTLIRDSAVARVSQSPGVQKSSSDSRIAITDEVEKTLQSQADEFRAQLIDSLQDAVKDATGVSAVAFWEQLNAGRDAWLDVPSFDLIRSTLDGDASVVYSLWAAEAVSTLSIPVGVPMHRREIRTENYELTNVHFNWISDFEVDATKEQSPEWALVFERMEGGRFYGFPVGLRIGEETVASEPAEIWKRMQPLHEECRARWAQRKDLETFDTGDVNLRQERARLELAETALDSGKESEAYQLAKADFEKQSLDFDAEYAEIRERIDALNSENDRFAILVRTAQDVEVEIALANIVRAYPANRISASERFSIYCSRWYEFLLDNPREANSEGGVYPAIFGTVVMTLLMSIVVVPFGVLAALYLREYATAGPLVSAVRIAINNLAGVPSIVFGVFGLGFFCYIVGAGVDELFYRAKTLEVGPTYGTGGLFWASLTLALLTLPVVIVATEEALAAVPRSMREGSLACGATRWQTIQRIVLPRAMPGIMTGMILAMARGAGEVAPLMLVGAVKLAPHLVVDIHDWTGSMGALPTGPLHPERSFMHLGFHIFDLGFQSQNSEAAKPMVYTTTLLLIGLIAAMNLLAVWLRARLRKKFQFSQF